VNSCNIVFSLDYFLKIKVGYFVNFAGCRVMYWSVFQNVCSCHGKVFESPWILNWRGGFTIRMSNVVIQLQYRDRAKERREKYGQPEPPLPKRSKRETEPEPVPWVLRLTLFVLPFCWLEDRKGIQSLKIFAQGFTFAIPVRNSVSLPSFFTCRCCNTVDCFTGTASSR